MLVHSLEQVGMNRDPLVLSYDPLPWTTTSMANVSSAYGPWFCYPCSFWTSSRCSANLGSSYKWMTLKPSQSVTNSLQSLIMLQFCTYSYDWLLSTLATLWSHVGTFTKYSCKGLTFGDFYLIGLGLAVHWELSKLPGCFQHATKVKNSHNKL